MYTSNVATAFLLSDAISKEITNMIWKDVNFSFEIASISENARLTLLVYMSLVLRITVSLYIMSVFKVHILKQCGYGIFTE
jgi:hypothetical protein